MDNTDLFQGVFSVRRAILAVGQYSEDRLKEIKEQCDSEGVPIVEHTTVGEYNLDLHKFMLPEFFPEPMYQVSISKGQINPWNAESRHTTFTTGFKDFKESAQALEFFKTQIKSWVFQHGAIFVGSENQSKFDVYIKLFRARMIGTGIAILYLGSDLVLLYDPASDYAKRLVATVPEDRKS